MTHSSITNRFCNRVRYFAQPHSSALKLEIDFEWFHHAESSQAELGWLQELIRLTETTRRGECLPQLVGIARSDRELSLELRPACTQSFAGLPSHSPCWKSAGDRRALWTGFGRLARSLHRLHQLGYVHRSLTPGAVLFRELFEPESWVLGGLETLARMGDAGSVRLDFGLPECGDLCEGGFSPDTDWLNFGGLVYRALMGAAPEWASITQTTLASLSEYERAFFHLLTRALLQGRPLLDLDIGDFCDAIARRLQLESRSGQRLRLRLSRKAADYARQQLGVSEKDAMSPLYAAVEDDLRNASVIWSDDREANLLVGASLVLVIRPNESYNERSWDIAFAPECLRGAWTSSALRESRSLVDSKLRIDVEVVGFQRFERGASFASWESFVIEPPVVKPTHRRYLDFLALTNAIDAMYRYRELLAFDRVEFVGPGQVRVDLCDLKGEPGQREGAAKDLERLRDESPQNFFLTFTPKATPRAQRQRDLANEAKYQLLEIDPDHRWIKLAAGRDSLLFRERQGVLRTEEHHGQISLIDRRRNAFAGLANQPLLLQRLVSPDASIQGQLLTDPKAKIARWIGPEAELDDSKHTALQQILSDPNSSAVRGPPGTGKTQLLAYMVRCIFEAQPLARILVTAQAQAAVAVMLERIRKVALRDHKHLPTLAHPKIRDHVRIKDVTARDVPSEASARDREELNAYTELQDYIVGRRTEIARDSIARRFLVRLIAALHKDPVMHRIFFLRDAAAPIVFCSSTARELVDLGRSREAFDWVVVEEAARAHAHDLVLPLALSARWVFIGDERQLEPYRFDNFADDVYDRKGEVRLCLSRMRRLQWRKYLPDRELVVAQAASEVEAWMSPFASIHRAARAGPPLSLSTQYRMARPIGDLISDVFYLQDGGISTAPKLAEEYAQPLWSWQGRFGALNGPALVWSRVRWAHGAKRQQYEEQDQMAPREIERIAEMMRSVQIRAPAEIAVLSPYARQVAELRRSPLIVSAFRALCVAAGADGLDDPLRLSEFLRRQICTVDSFQGREADLVFVSLVRNNQGLMFDSPDIGFLSDRLRSNVMLSRARRQLVLVGALEQFDRQSHGHWPEITRRFVTGHHSSGELHCWHPQGVAP